MPRRCSVYGCRSNYDTESETTTTFALPRDEERRKLWLCHIATDFSKLKNPIVCIKHFADSDIIRIDKVMYKGEMREFLRIVPKLAVNAVPTIFPVTPPYCSQLLPTVERLGDVQDEHIETAIEIKEEFIEEDGQRDCEIKEEFIEEDGQRDYEGEMNGLGCFYQVECNASSQGPADCVMEVEETLQQKHTMECPRSAEMERLEARVGRLECLLELLLSKVAAVPPKQSPPPQDPLAMKCIPNSEVNHAATTDRVIRPSSPVYSSMNLATRIGLQLSRVRRKGKIVQGESSLISAARAGHLPSVKFLLHNSPEPVEVGRALHTVGSADVVEALCEFYPEIVQGADGARALCFAAERGRATVLRALLEAGANPNSGNRYTLTALHKAALKGHTECVYALLRRGADVRMVTSTQCTALHMAAKSGTAECVSALVKAGVILEAVDNAGCSALHYAAGCNFERAVQILLEAGASPHLRNLRGKMPVDMATSELVVTLLNGKKEMVTEED